MAKTTMKSIIIFAIIAFSSSLLPLSHVEATSRSLSMGPVAPALEEICSKTEFSKECSSALVQFLPPGNIDASSALIAGLKALDALTNKAIDEAEILSRQNITRPVAEELLVGMTVYFVISNSTNIAQEAIRRNEISDLIKEIKLASDVSGELVDTFKEGIDGKNDILKDINVYVHNLAQNNFSILGMVMKAHNDDQSDQRTERKEAEDVEENNGGEDYYHRSEEEEEEEEDYSPAAAPAPDSVPEDNPPF